MINGNNSGNPYHDKSGKFTSKENQGVGGSQKVSANTGNPASDFAAGLWNDTMNRSDIKASDKILGQMGINNNDIANATYEAKRDLAYKGGWKPDREGNPKNDVNHFLINKSLDNLVNYDKTFSDETGLNEEQIRASINKEWAEELGYQLKNDGVPEEAIPELLEIFKNEAPTWEEVDKKFNDQKALDDLGDKMNKLEESEQSNDNETPAFLKVNGEWIDVKGNHDEWGHNYFVKDNDVYYYSDEDGLEHKVGKLEDSSNENPNDNDKILNQLGVSNEEAPENVKKSNDLGINSGFDERKRQSNRNAFKSLVDNFVNGPEAQEIKQKVVKTKKDEQKYQDIMNRLQDYATQIQDKQLSAPFQREIHNSALDKALAEGDQETVDRLVGNFILYDRAIHNWGPIANQVIENLADEVGSIFKDEVLDAYQKRKKHFETVGQKAREKNQAIRDNERTQKVREILQQFPQLNGNEELVRKLVEKIESKNFDFLNQKQ